ncbi:MAG: EpsI family protein [Planctomycetes bacterium]|nr:EpsI family protein [Planctomycetota bacterium]
MATAHPAGRQRWLTAAGWLLLLAGLAATYAQTFAEMWRRWFPAWHHAHLGLYDRIVGGESYYTHGPVVPPVSLIIAILLIRHTRLSVRPQRLLGLLVLAASLAVHLAACFARVNFVSGFSLIGVLAGLILIVWGTPALRRLWFPLALLAFMVPLPEVSIAQLNFRLKLLAADWGVSLAGALGVIVERSGNQVLLEGDKTFVIANVCNGLRTLISLLGFGAIYAYVCKLRGWWRLALFAMSVPVAVASNSLRIVGLIVVADVWDVPTAAGWYHDTSGILIYPVAFAMMFGIERLVLWARKAVGKPATVEPLFHDVLRGPGDDDQWPRMAHAVGGRAGAAAVALLLVVGGVTLALNRSVPSVWNQALARAAMPTALEMDGRRWESYDLVMDDRTLDILETRDYLYRRYFSPGLQPVDFCVIFSRDNRKGTHPPDLCLEGGGQDIVEKRDVVLPNVEGRGEVRCRALVVQTGTSRQHFLYVYKCGDEYTPSFWRQQFAIFANGLLGRSASGALIRVSTSADDNAEAANRRTMMMLGIALPYLDRALP